MTERLERREQDAIDEFLNLLDLRYGEHVREAVMFGSKARGDSRPWSDIDILIIVDHEDWRLSHAISDIAADVGLAHNVLIAPQVIGQERWERMARDQFTLHRNIAAEGIPLS